MIKGSVLSDNVLAVYVGDDTVDRMYVGDYLAWAPISAESFDIYYAPDPEDF